tara:strand:- start:1170 stop:1664 length:495 start_codon:yes stop_codon:yes gene_type:complete
MSLLDNIKSSFLGNRNSFNVTFNNRNPLSYVGDASIPSHGSSIQTQMEAPAVEDVYKAHSPKEYLAAETKMHQAKGGALGKVASGVIGAVAGKAFGMEGGFGERFMEAGKKGIFGVGSKQEDDSFFKDDGSGELKDDKKFKSEYDSNEVMEEYCERNPNSYFCG